MTYSQTAPPATGAPGTLKKPGTLLALVVISAISALSGLIGAIYVFAGGRGLAESYATSLVTSNPEVFDLDTVMETMGTDNAQDVVELAKSVDMWDSVVSIAHAELIFKAFLLIIFAAPLLLFTLLALKGATWARVLITVFAILSLFGGLATAFGYGPQLLNITGFIGLPTAIIAVVLCWLPANNRYAKARKPAA
ncbi:hypothetical protein [Saccharopolyspora pogona]|uniref:hypothetical protein n=1 Tax=Saccharopolyspora pogona TaxID=333966 RepID=UPI001683E7FF|nr:hypothetical protein [Saccharopolyspora pogona]